MQRTADNLDFERQQLTNETTTTTPPPQPPPSDRYIPRTYSRRKPRELSRYRQSRRSFKITDGL